VKQGIIRFKAIKRSSHLWRSPRLSPARGEAVCDSNVPGVRPTSAATPARSPELLHGASRGCKSETHLQNLGNSAGTLGEGLFWPCCSPQFLSPGQPCSGSAPRAISDASEDGGSFPLCGHAPLSLPVLFWSWIHLHSAALSVPPSPKGQPRTAAPNGSPVQTPVPGQTPRPGSGQQPPGWTRDPPPDAPEGHGVPTLQADLSRQEGSWRCRARTDGPAGIPPSRGIRSPRGTGPTEKQQVPSRARGAVSKQEPAAQSPLANQMHLTDHSAENHLHPRAAALSPGSAPARSFHVSAASLAAWLRCPCYNSLGKDPNPSQCSVGIGESPVSAQNERRRWAEHAVAGVVCSSVV